MTTIRRTTTHSKPSRQGCRERGSLGHRCWECKLIQTLQKSMWLFLKILKIDLPFDRAVALMSMHAKYISMSTSDRHTCSFLLTAAPPTVAKEGVFQDGRHRWTDKENVANTCCGILFSHEEESNGAICRKIDGTGNHIKEKNPDPERQTLRGSFSLMQSLDVNVQICMYECVCVCRETEKGNCKEERRDSRRGRWIKQPSTYKKCCP